MIVPRKEKEKPDPSLRYGFTFDTMDDVQSAQEAN